MVTYPFYYSFFRNSARVKFEKKKISATFGYEESP